MGGCTVTDDEEHRAVDECGFVKVKQGGKMINPRKLKMVTVAFAVSILAGCSSGTATKSDLIASSSSSEGVAKKPLVQPASQKLPASSLEAHRQGTAPAPSPLEQIYFDFDRYDLHSNARATLKANLEWLNANPAQRIEIEGHCDERGTSEYNLALGAKRAQAAKDYLLSLGISPQRITTTSYGEELPMCREQNEACYQMNRRDRFAVIIAHPAA